MKIVHSLMIKQL